MFQQNHTVQITGKWSRISWSDHFVIIQIISTKSYCSRVGFRIASWNDDLSHVIECNPFDNIHNCELMCFCGWPEWAVFIQKKWIHNKRSWWDLLCTYTIVHITLFIHFITNSSSTYVSFRIYWPFHIAHNIIGDKAKSKVWGPCKS